MTCLGVTLSLSFSVSFFLFLYLIQNYQNQWLGSRETLIPLLTCTYFPVFIKTITIIILITRPIYFYCKINIGTQYIFWRVNVCLITLFHTVILYFQQFFLIIKITTFNTTNEIIKFEPWTLWQERSWKNFFYNCYPLRSSPILSV